jgi:hypothetical protein
MTPSFSKASWKRSGFCLHNVGRNRDLHVGTYDRPHIGCTVAATSTGRRKQNQSMTDLKVCIFSNVFCKHNWFLAQWTTLSDCMHYTATDKMLISLWTVNVREFGGARGPKEHTVIGTRTVIFQVPTAASIKMAVFRVVAPCILVEVY